MQRFIEVMKERKITEPLSVFIPETCDNIFEGEPFGDGSSSRKTSIFFALVK